MEALKFPTKDTSTSVQQLVSYSCPCCSFETMLSQTILQHMEHEHKIKIAHRGSILFLQCYLREWKKCLACMGDSVLPEPSPNGIRNLDPSSFPFECEIRRRAHQQSLGEVLRIHEAEREDKNFRRQCLFCSEVIQGERSTLFLHMREVHGFNMGNPDNLVGITELLQILQQKLDSLQCIYCHKVFKSRSVLKLHMRKKKHFRIDPRDTTFDRFYLINYLDPDRTWRELKREPDDEDDDEEEANEAEGSTHASGSRDEVPMPTMMPRALLHLDNDLDSWAETLSQRTAPTMTTMTGTLGEGNERWEDWDEDVDESAKCLFCRRVLDTPTEAFVHMARQHRFDINVTRREWGLDFYKCVKLINFIRRKVHQNRCSFCDAEFSDEAALEQHLIEHVSHCSVARDGPWDDPRYMFPTFENDPLLTSFEGEDDIDADTQQAGAQRFLDEGPMPAPPPRAPTAPAPAEPTTTTTSTTSATSPAPAADPAETAPKAPADSESPFADPVEDD